VADILGMDKNFFLNLDKGTSTKLQTINEYLLEQINENDLEDSKKVYNNTMSGLLKELGINKEEKSSNKINKLYLAIVLRKLIL